MKPITVHKYGTWTAPLPKRFVPIRTDEQADLVLCAYDMHKSRHAPTILARYATVFNYSNHRPVPGKFFDTPMIQLDDVTPTAEHALALMFILDRKVHLASSCHGLVDRDDFLTPTMLSRRKAFIYGIAGRLGTMLYDRCLPLFDEVGGTDIRGHADLSFPLNDADIVFVATNRTPADPTIGEAELSVMKPTTGLVSISNREAVDFGAVIKALKRDKLRFFATDIVFPSDLTTYYLEIRDLHLEGRLAITPHMGGSTLDAREIVEGRLFEAAASYIDEVRP